MLSHYEVPVSSPRESRSLKSILGLAEAIIPGSARTPAADETTVARNLARQLVVFATGAPVRYTDREELERILQRASTRKYGVRALVEEIVGSDLFQNK